MKRWVWVVAGGILQVPLIREAQNQDYSVLVTDQNPDAPGAKIANQFVQISTYDIDGHLQLAEKIKIKPIAVLTMGADVGPTVSAVADSLGLFAETYTTAHQVRNKGLMRKLTQSINPHPQFLLSGFDEPGIAQKWLRIMGVDRAYPCVIKPLDNCGSRGISLVKRPFQFTEALRIAQKHSRRISRLAIVEEYMSGPEVALDFFVYKNRMYWANGSWRLFGEFGQEIGYINPWEPDRNLKNFCRQIKDALGVTWGPLKIDLKCTKEYGWILMEAATRLSGGFDSSYTAPLSSGKNLADAMLDMAITGKLDSKKLRATRKKTAFVWSARLWQQNPIVPESEIYLGNTPFEAYRKARKGK